MKILKIVGIIVFLVIVLFFIIGIFAPKKYSVERSIVINAPTEFTYYYASKFSFFPKWEPWGKKDSTQTFKIKGEDGKVGAIYTWKGKMTGEGELKITSMRKNNRIDYWLHFVKPREDEAKASLIFEDQNANTKVTWKFYGKSPFPWNVMLLFMSMDKMLGPDLAKGLENLKVQVETLNQNISSYEIKQIPFGPKTYAIIQDTVPIKELSKFFEKSYPRIMQVIKKKRAKILGVPSALYFNWDDQNGMTKMAAAIPVNKKIEMNGVESFEIGKNRALVIDHYGAYDHLEYAHYAMDFYLYRTGLKAKSPVIEEYITDPTKEKDSSKWLTKVIYLVQ